MLAARQPVPNWPEAVTPAAREAFEAALHDPAFGSCATFREQCSFLAQYNEALTCHQIASSSPGQPTWFSSPPWKPKKPTGRESNERGEGAV